MASAANEIQNAPQTFTQSCRAARLMLFADASRNDALKMRGKASLSASSKGFGGWCFGGSMWKSSCTQEPLHHGSHGRDLGAGQVSGSLRVAGTEQITAIN